MKVQERGKGVKIRESQEPPSIDPRKIAATTIIGDKVMNLAGQELGKIEEVMFDLSAGVLSYLVLSVGGFAGIGDKLFAVPLEVLTFDPREKVFYLDIDKKSLKKVKGFDKANWPSKAIWPPADGK